MGERPFLLRLYSGTLSLIGAPAAGILLRWRQRRGKELATRLAERRGRASRVRPDGRLIWVHAASVGEFLAILPLVETLCAKGFHVLVTTVTITSARLATMRLPSDSIHQFVPLDVPVFVRRFFSHWRPDLVIFTESELWPNTLMEAESRSIPVVIANARMSERSFRRWQKAPRVIGSVLKDVDLCLAQSDADAQRLASLGASRVQNAGNLKFDVPPPPAPDRELRRMKQAVMARPVFVAASTHPGENEMVLRLHARIQSRATDRLLTIIVPRHPDGAEIIIDAARKLGLQTALRSEVAEPSWDTDIFVADTIGELGIFYRLADVAFVGGSIVPRGGQNPIEPAKLGVPILHGPHVKNFAEIYAELDEERGALGFSNPESFAIAVSGLLADSRARELMREAAKRVIDRNSGALQRTMAAIEPYLMQLDLVRG